MAKIRQKKIISWSSSFVGDPACEDCLKTEKYLGQQYQSSPPASLDLIEDVPGIEIGKWVPAKTIRRCSICGQLWYFLYDSREGYFKDIVRLEASFNALLREDGPIQDIVSLLSKDFPYPLFLLEGYIKNASFDENEAFNCFLDKLNDSSLTFKQAEAILRWSVLIMVRTAPHKKEVNQHKPCIRLKNSEILFDCLNDRVSFSTSSSPQEKGSFRRRLELFIKRAFGSCFSTRFYKKVDLVQTDETTRARLISEIKKDIS